MKNDKEVETNTFRLTTPTKAVRCPVCSGSGVYVEPPMGMTSNAAPNTRSCHGCGGNGWVAI